MKLLFITTVVSAIVCGAGAAASPVQNGGFETGDLSGWDVGIPTLVAGPNSSMPGASVPAGQIGVLETLSGYLAYYTNSSAVRLPKAGQYFAAVETTAPPLDPNAGNPSSYDVYLSQELTLSVGDSVSGWALVANSDPYSDQVAWVRILDSNSSEIATPWQESSGGNGDAWGHGGYQGWYDWANWSWDAPADGQYTIQCGISALSQFGVDSFSFYACFDEIAVTQQVPEPGAGGLLILSFSLALLPVFRSRLRAPRKRNPVRA